MKTNTKSKVAKVRTAEGAVARNINAEQQLRRSLLTCLLWEDTAYEDGQTVADRIRELVAKVKPEKVAALAIEARELQKLRHAPLLLVREMARLPTHRHLVAQTLERVIQRADELAEFLAIYWKDGKCPVSAQVKKGLAAAFKKFGEYDLAKYNRDGAVKLRDVLFLCHAKPENKTQERLWKKLVNNKLKTPGTWENELSAGQGEGKKESWTTLLKEKRLGALALLRNVRNMKEAGVSNSLIKNALKEMKTERVLPFRFIAAARYAPAFEPELEEAMFKCLKDADKLKGKTILLVDVSGSMDAAISAKSDLNRLEAACGLAMLLREVCEDLEIHTFSNQTVLVPARHGFALRDAIVNSQDHCGTYLGKAIQTVEDAKAKRLIVITDEQSHDRVPNPKTNGYMINVSTERHGVGYGPFIHIDGWSEAIVDFIRELEQL